MSFVPFFLSFDPFFFYLFLIFEVVLFLNNFCLHPLLFFFCSISIKSFTKGREGKVGGGGGGGGDEIF